MMKNWFAVFTVVAVLLVGSANTASMAQPAPASPVSDRVEDEINTYADQPGMVDYLHTLRNLMEGTGNPTYQWSTQDSIVREVAGLGLFYCGVHPSPFTEQEWADYINEVFPDIAPAYIAATEQLCTHY